MRLIRKLIDTLTSPAAAVTEARDRISAQVHSGLLLVVCVSAFASSLGTFFPGPGDATQKLGLRAIALGFSVVWLALYAVSRTRFFRVAIVVWLVGMPLAILGATLSATVPEVVFSVSCSYLLITIGSASIALRGRWVAVVVVGCVLVAFLAALAAGLPGVFAVPVIAFLLSGTAMVLASSAVARASEREAAARMTALQAEKAQREQAESHSSHLEEVIERTDEFILAFTEDLSVLEANQSARTRLGLPAQGGSLSGVFTQEGLATLRVALREVRGQPQWAGLLPCVSEHRVLVTSAVILSHPASSGRGAFFSGIFRDVSVERQLRHLERMDSIGQLAGGVAHDFNNTLTAIVAAAEGLRIAIPDGDAREDVEIILKAATRSAELTRKLLTLSRRSDVGAKRRVDVPGLLTEVASVLRRTLPRSIEVHVRAEPGPLTVLGDPLELEHVFLNLAVNARDAMPDGGTLTFSTKPAVLDATFASGHAPLSPGAHVCIEVTDTGHGMSAEVFERVFEPFFTTKSEGKGTGLGLASAYGTVRAHKGRISVASVPEHGTTFSILLPSSTAERARLPARARPVSGLRAILVIDDDALVREALGRTLAPYAATVIEADSGADGIVKLERHLSDVDAVVLDLVMPGMDGAATLAALRTRAPRLPVVLVSGFTHDVRVSELLKFERVAFVPKPVQLDDLRVALGSVVVEPLNVA
jgi:two-component system, cell cycle sensor histidine kinase and response regulator CckA